MQSNLKYFCLFIIFYIHINTSLIHVERGGLSKNLDMIPQDILIKSEWVCILQPNQLSSSSPITTYLITQDFMVFNHINMFSNFCKMAQLRTQSVFRRRQRTKEDLGQLYSLSALILSVFQYDKIMQRVQVWVRTK